MVPPRIYYICENGSDSPYSPQGTQPVQYSTVHTLPKCRYTRSRRPLEVDPCLLWVLWPRISKGCVWLHSVWSPLFLKALVWPAVQPVWGPKVSSVIPHSSARMSGWQAEREKQNVNVVINAAITTHDILTSLPLPQLGALHNRPSMAIYPCE